MEITEEEFDRCVGINTKGLYFSMQEAAKRIADNGRIINIGTSLLGATTGMYSAYAGTKAPVEAFTRALAKEIGKRGITVNVVAPGAVDTPFFHRQETPETVEYVRKGHVFVGLVTGMETTINLVNLLTKSGRLIGWQFFNQLEDSPQSFTEAYRTFMPLIVSGKFKPVEKRRGAERRSLAEFGLLTIHKNAVGAFCDQKSLSQ